MKGRERALRARVPRPELPATTGARALHAGPGREASRGKEEPRRNPAPFQVHLHTPTQPPPQEKETAEGSLKPFLCGNEPRAFVHMTWSQGRGWPPG